MLIKFNLYNCKYRYHNNNLQHHRLDGPCAESYHGDKFWYKNGKSHREDGSAVEYYSGDNYYYIDGMLYGEKKYWAIVRFKGFV